MTNFDNMEQNFCSSYGRRVDGCEWGSVTAVVVGGVLLIGGIAWGYFM